MDIILTITRHNREHDAQIVSIKAFLFLFPQTFSVFIILFLLLSSILSAIRWLPRQAVISPKHTKPGMHLFKQTEIFTQTVLKLKHVAHNEQDPETLKTTYVNTIRQSKSSLFDNVCQNEGVYSPTCHGRYRAKSNLFSPSPTTVFCLLLI